MRRLTAIAVVLLAACAKAPPKPVELPPDPRDEVKALVSQLYSSLEYYEPERLNDVLTADVMAYGLGPKDTFTNRDSLIDAMRGELVPFGLRGDAFKLTTTNVHLGIAEGGQSAWFYDFPRFEQVRSGKDSKFWAVRVTGHAIQDDAKWRIDALHVSFGFPDAELYAADAPRKLKAPEPAGASKGPDTEQVLGLMKRMLDDIAVKVDRTSDSSDAVLIGTDATDVFEGGAKFKELARPKLPALKRAAFSLKLEDGPRARVGPGRKSGWVTGVVVLRLGRGASAKPLPGFRALWLFTEEKDGWRLVSEHQSLGLTYELRKPDAAAKQ